MGGLRQSSETDRGRNEFEVMVRSDRRIAKQFRFGTSLAVAILLLSIGVASASVGTHDQLGNAVPVCRSIDLDLAYAGGQPATGFFFAQVMIWNVGSESCRLEGPIRIVGTYKGSPDTNALGYGVVANLVLTPRRDPGPLWSSPRGEEVAAAIPIEAGYRDDPNAPNGLCSTHRIVPAAWSVSIDGVPRTVPDWNPSSTS